MPKKEDHFKILLEEIKANTRLAFDGISNIEGQVKSLKSDMHFLDKKYDLTAKILAEEIKEVKEIVSRIDQKLDEHVRQPVHA